jgi:hypothetical protein
MLGISSGTLHPLNASVMRALKRNIFIDHYLRRFGRGNLLCASLESTDKSYGAANMVED